MSSDWKETYRVGSVHRGSDGNKYLVYRHAAHADDGFWTVVLGTEFNRRFGPDGVHAHSPELRLVEHIGDMILQPVGRTLVPVDPGVLEAGWRALRFGLPKKGQWIYLDGRELHQATFDFKKDPYLVVEPIEPPQKPDQEAKQVESPLPSKAENPHGMHRRYNVTHADGSPTDPAAFYWVMRLDFGGKDYSHVKAGRAAAREWARDIIDSGAGHLQKNRRGSDCLPGQDRAEAGPARGSPQSRRANQVRQRALEPGGSRQAR